MKKIGSHSRYTAFIAAIAIASCSQGPAAPTSARTEVITQPGVPDGSSRGSAAGDVKSGPIEIDLVRVAQTNGVPAFYAFANGEYVVRPEREVEIYVQIWTANPAVATPPRVIVDWGVGDTDNIHCGPCRLSRTYKSQGKYKVKVTMDDRVGGVTSRSFTLNVVNAEDPGGTFSFSNNTPIAINDNVAATPYPSNVNVSGVSGKITEATVTIHGYTHTFHGDLIVLLVAPDGRTVALMGFVNSGGNGNNATVTFADGAPPFSVGSFGPGSFTFSINNAFAPSSAYAPAPAPPFGNTLSVLNGADPNGTWRLFVGDYAGADIGQIAGGWTLNFTTGASTASAGVQAGSAGVSASSWSNDHILNYPHQKPDPRE